MHILCACVCVCVSGLNRHIHIAQRHMTMQILKGRHVRQFNISVSVYSTF